MAETRKQLFVQQQSQKILFFEIFSWWSSMMAKQVSARKIILLKPNSAMRGMGELSDQMKVSERPSESKTEMR